MHSAQLGPGVLTELAVVECAGSHGIYGFVRLDLPFFHHWSLIKFLHRVDLLSVLLRQARRIAPPRSSSKNKSSGTHRRGWLAPLNFTPIEKICQ